MKIVKFEGATLRDALARVKAELGDQAVIVSTRQIRKGLIGSAYEIAAAIEPDDDAGARPSTPRFATANTPTSAYRGGRATTPGPAPQRGAVDDAIAPVKAELRSLRAMVRASSSDRASAELRTELASLRKRLDDLGRAPAPAATPTAAPARAAAPAPQPKKSVALSRTAEIAAASHAQVVAMVGPTGVGKTTTIAKIAARAALVDGKSVALISLDNYRVGGVDQIRTFADLIGIPLAIAERPVDLIEHLAQLDGNDLILVDTAGRSPRDERAIDELGQALGRVRGLEAHLVVQAATSGAVLDDLLARYAALRPQRLLFTKLDETGAAPELVDAPARHHLPVTWLGTGQAVPEDLEEASAQRLVELARLGFHAATSHRAA